MQRISDQLKEYCDCVEFDDKDVSELVSIVSAMTCWQTEPCDNFLLDERKEVIPLPSCMDCVYEFAPYYKPFDPDSFAFSLVKRQGTKETATPIADFSYSTLDGKFRLDTGLPSCKCSCNACECEPEYFLLATYAAGYEEIPDCLLPVFCNLIEVIHAKNKCECCDDNCGCGDNGAPEIRYAKGDVVTVQLETDIGKMLVEQYKNEIAVMSLCRECSGIWGVVV